MCQRNIIQCQSHCESVHDKLVFFRRFVDSTVEMAREHFINYFVSLPVFVNNRCYIPHVVHLYSHCPIHIFLFLRDYNSLSTDLLDFSVIQNFLAEYYFGVILRSELFP